MEMTLIHPQTTGLASLRDLLPKATELPVSMPVLKGHRQQTPAYIEINPLHGSGFIPDCIEFDPLHGSVFLTFWKK